MLTRKGAASRAGACKDDVPAEVAESIASSGQSSRRSSMSAKRAALKVEMAAMVEKERIEQEILRLQQEAKRLEVATEIAKLDAEEAVLDLEDEEKSRTSDVPPSTRQERVATWVNQAQPNNNIEDLLSTIHLPKADMMSFDGDVIQYPTFISAFDNVVGKHNIDGYAKLTRLLQYCTGKARKVIESCASQEDGYTRARQLLNDRFGDRHTICSAWINRIMTAPKVLPSTIQDFADELQNFRETLNNIDSLAEVNQHTLVQIISKLPTYVQHRWKSRVVKIRERGSRPSLDDLLHFVRGVSKEVSDPVYGCLGETRKKVDEQGSKKKTFMSAATDSKETQPCELCDSNCLFLFRCKRFLDMSPEERFQFARTKRLCFNCLKKGHSGAECRSEKTCKAPGCTLKHSKFLHTATKDVQRGARDQRESSSEKMPEQTATCNHVRSSGRVALPIVEVLVKGKGDRSVRALALLDNCSTNSFCSLKLLNELGEHGTRSTISLTTLDNQDKSVRTTIHELYVSDVTGRHTTFLNNVIARPSIPVGRSCLPRSEDLIDWPHLRHLDLPIVTNECEVQLLIGQDCPEALMPLEIQVAEGADPGSAPFALKTIFGWTLNGPLKGRSSASTTYFVSMSLEEQVERFWKVENPPTLSREFSVEDHRALQIWKQSLAKEDGHYQVAIPFKKPESCFPNNRKLAEQRLKSLKGKLERNPQLHAKYTAKMNELFAAGHAERVLDDSVSDKPVWYLPHHAVVNQNKPKLRIVFDCAAKCQNTSLNSEALQGPDLMNSLVGVLLRFREHPIAVTADIEAMFHQIKVPHDNRDCLRFLWWKDGCMTEEPVIYRMTVHLFGGTWCPSVSAFILHQTAEDNIQDFGPEVVDTVKNNFYVDDCLKSVKTEEEATKLVKELRELLARGGFRLTKWSSNSKTVLKSIPEKERADHVRDVGMHSSPSEQALGISWNAENDSFGLRTVSEMQPMTRRGMLSMVCSMFDPMGFISPFIVKGKQLVQEMARRKLDWDQSVPEDLMEPWSQWLNELVHVPELHIDRCLHPVAFGNVQRCELHHFSDASETAYGSVCYVRLVNTEGMVHCTLLFSRSRLAPLKMLTIPRLELSAATLAVKLDEMLRRELSIHVDESIFWTDSTIVLSYIANTNKRFHTFVANRLTTIHELSTPSQWRHVRTEENPADDISRGKRITDLLSGCWLHGPKWLWKDCPMTNMDKFQPSDLAGEVEIKADRKLFATEATSDVIADLIDGHSSWTKLRRSVAWLLRFKDYIRARFLRQTQNSSSCLNLDEVKAAEHAIIRYVQETSFSDEVQSLKERGTVKVESKLYRLDPVISDQNIIVCKGRVPSCYVTEATYNPAIIPKGHHIATLIARHMHELHGHSGKEYTIAEIRKNYWIINVGGLVRKLITNCFKCRKLYSMPTNQRMGDIPRERVKVNNPPFTCVGVDCFGPFSVKFGRKTMKRYGCIFTCMTVRAIHIEVLSSLDTHAFVNGLQRFISRRGRPDIIVSDNGTNFVGAQRALREAIQDWNHSQIGVFLQQRDIEWRFNPPGAPHMGGVWERLIRMIKRTLSSVLGEQSVDDDNLSTIMCLVEGIINNRPLTAVSDDPKDLEPLTPNHLLLLRQNSMYPPGLFVKEDNYVRKRWRQVQYLADVFWRRWVREYLPLLQRRPKWLKERENLKPGDIVLVVDNTAPRQHWQVGRVVKVNTGRDMLVRSAEVKTRSSTVTRPVNKLCFLEECEN